MVSCGPSVINRAVGMLLWVSHDTPNDGTDETANMKGSFSHRFFLIFIQFGVSSVQMRVRVIFRHHSSVEPIQKRASRIKYHRRKTDESFISRLSAERVYLVCSTYV